MRNLGIVLKKTLVTTLAASLITAAPGLAPYQAFAQVVSARPVVGTAVPVFGVPTGAPFALQAPGLSGPASIGSLGEVKPLSLLPTGPRRARR